MSRCLVIKNDGIGDLVLAIDQINHLSNCFEGKLDILCCEISKPIAERYLNVQKIFTVSRDLHLMLPPKKHRFFLAYLKDIVKSIIYRPTKNDRLVAEMLRNTKYETVIVLRRFIRQSTFYYMKNVVADEKICCWQYPTNLSVQRAKKLSSGWTHLESEHEIRHESEYYKRILEPKYGVISTTQLGKHGCNDNIEKNIAAIVLGNVKKGLSPDLWKNIMVLLQEKGYVLEVYGGKDAEKEYHQFCKKHSIKLHAGKLGLIESADRISQKAATILGNDTGLMHLVACSDAKFLVICSGETPYRFFPWASERNQYVIYNGLDCYDCGYCSKAARYCVDMSLDDLKKLIVKVLSEEVQPGVLNISNKKNYNIAYRWVSGVSGSI